MSYFIDIQRVYGIRPRSLNYPLNPNPNARVGSPLNPTSQHVDDRLAATMTPIALRGSAARRGGVCSTCHEQNATTINSIPDKEKQPKPY